MISCSDGPGLIYHSHCSLSGSPSPSQRAPSRLLLCRLLLLLPPPHRRSTEYSTLNSNVYGVAEYGVQNVVQLLLLGLRIYSVSGMKAVIIGLHGSVTGSEEKCPYPPNCWIDSRTPVIGGPHGHTRTQRKSRVFLDRIAMPCLVFLSKTFHNKLEETPSLE